VDRLGLCCALPAQTEVITELRDLPNLAAPRAYPRHWGPSSRGSCVSIGR